MNQIQVNEIISEIVEKLVVLIEEEDKLDNLINLRKVYDLFNDPDTDWRVFYYINDFNVLKDWQGELSDIYYLIDTESSEKIKSRYTMLDSISEVLLRLLKESSSFKNYSVEDNKYSNFIKNYLKQYKNFYFLTSNVKQFEKDIKNLELEFNKISVRKKVADLEEQKITELVKTGNDIVDDLKVKRNFLNKLTDETTNNEIKYLYNNIYDEELDLADKYRNWALGIFTIIGFILLFGFMNFSIQNWNHLRDSSYIHIPLGWESLVKTLMLFSLTTPAWYLARESSKHRKVAYKAKMLGTELASFPLYAREFKDEERLELRKQLADRFFGQELYSDSKVLANSENSLDQIKLLTEANKILVESLRIKKAAE